MRKNSYTWIVFDVGAVLIEIDLEAPVVALAKLTGIEQSRIKEFFSENFHLTGSPWTHESYQTGKINTVEYLEILRTYLENKVTESDLKEAIYLVLGKEKEDVLQMLKELAKNYKIACFSNTTPLHWDKLKTYCNFYQHLKGECTSFGVGEVKPRSQAYIEMLKALGASADQVIFIDDSKRNVEAAEKLGIAAVHFTNAVELKQQLSTRFQIL